VEYLVGPVVPLQRIRFSPFQEVGESARRQNVVRRRSPLRRPHRTDEVGGVVEDVDGSHDSFLVGERTDIYSTMGSG